VSEEGEEGVLMTSQRVCWLTRRCSCCGIAQRVLLPLVACLTDCSLSHRVEQKQTTFIPPDACI
jgi:hypothetical protein